MTGRAREALSKTSVGRVEASGTSVVGSRSRVGAHVARGADHAVCVGLTPVVTRGSAVRWRARVVGKLLAGVYFRLVERVLKRVVGRPDRAVAV